MYADDITDSMQRAISETHRRRALQQAYNLEHGIDPQTIRKAVTDILAVAAGATEGAPLPGRDTTQPAAGPGPRATRRAARDELARLVLTLEEEMHEAAAELRFEYAANCGTRSTT